MTAAEMIDRLRELPPETELVFDRYDADTEDPRKVKWLWYFPASRRVYVA